MRETHSTSIPLLYETPVLHGQSSGQRALEREHLFDCSIIFVMVLLSLETPAYDVHHQIAIYGIILFEQ